jgi:preprotein translocase subunit SecG
MEILLMLLMFLVALFLILLVLVQRGRGGGLAGALGGMGGQSAFGTKAGDLFTRVTIVAAAVWIILCMATVKLLGTSENKFAGFEGKSSAPAAPGQGTAPGATAPQGADSSTTPGSGESSAPASGESAAPANGGAEKASSAPSDTAKDGAEKSE